MKDKVCWLVFAKSSHIRDAQAFTGKRDLTYDLDADEDGWRDINGPVLCAIYRDISREEAERRVHTMYPDAGMDAFSIVTTSQLAEDDGCPVLF